MRRISNWLLGLAAILLALSLAGSARADLVKGNDASAFSKNIWQFDAEGNATNVQSQMHCPNRIGDMVRDLMVAYNETGTDVSCEYRLGSVIVTLYLTFAPGADLSSSFQSAKDAILKRVPEATPLPDAGQTTFASSLPWLHTVYSIYNGRDDTGVWLADLHGWLFEIRADYAPNDEAVAFAWMKSATDAIIDAPGRHFEACAKAPVATRDGSETTGDKAETSVLMLTIISATDRDERFAEDWCAERLYPEIGPLAFWRNIASDAHNGPVDRITYNAGDTQYVLVVSANATVDKVNSELGKKGQTFIVSETRGNTVLIYAVYQGRPDPVTLGNLARDILTDRRKPLGSYSIDGKNITISMPSDAQ